MAGSEWIVLLPVFLETFSKESNDQNSKSVDYSNNNMINTKQIFHLGDPFLGGGCIFHHGVPPTENQHNSRTH